MRKNTKLQNAAIRLRKAAQERDAAREVLARNSRPSDPHHIVDSSVSWMETALGKARKKLLSIPGVVGVGLGHRWCDGLLTLEPCITVLVEKKLLSQEMRERKLRIIPKFTRIGKRTLRIDVVEFGTLERHVQVGDDIGPAQMRRAGTLGVFARDIQNNSSIAITAMHVSGFNVVPTGNIQSIPFCSPSRVTDNVSPQFADLVSGTTSRIDAAKLRLQVPQATGGVVPGLGSISGWRPLTFPGDMRTTVFMCGAVSGLQQGFIVNTSIDLPADGLESAILVNIPSSAGDSGSAIVDSQRFVLGFLVGAGNTNLRNLRVFCPVGLVFSILGCDIP